MVVWRFILCLVMLAFSCRATIPPGYMPTLADNKRAVVVLTLCAPNGLARTVLLDLQRRGKTSSDHTQAEAQCPFGIVMSQGVLPVHASLVPAAAVWLTCEVLFSRCGNALPPQIAAGPPLGSRAPPIHSRMTST